MMSARHIRVLGQPLPHGWPAGQRLSDGSPLEYQKPSQTIRVMDEYTAPKSPAHGRRAAKAEDAQMLPTGKSGLVLVVDDDPDIVDLLADALGTEGYDVLTAVGGDAIQLAHDRQPSLILLDLMMPGMDGVEVSMRLRADPSTARIPIVIMSAQEHLLETSRDMLVDDYLAKPFHLRSLYTTVAEWCRSA